MRTSLWTRRLARLVIAPCALLLGFQTPSLAQTGDWSGGVDSSWINPANWAGGTLPGNNNTAIAQFSSGQTVVNQDSGGTWTVNRVRLLNTSYTFNGGEISFDGTAPIIEAFGAGTTTFNNPVTFLQVPTFNTLVGDLTFTGVLSNSFQGLRKMSSGQLTITQTNLALGGPVQVQGGTLTMSQTGIEPTRELQIDAGANLNTGPAYWALLLGQGNLNLTGDTQFDGAFASTFSGNITGAGGFITSGVNTTLLGNNSFFGGITFASPGTLTIGNGTTGTFPNGPVFFTAPGTLILNPTGVASITIISAPAFTTPAMVVNGGTINVIGPWNFGDGNITVNGGNVVATNVTTGGVLTVAAPGVFTSDLATMRGLSGNGIVTTNLSLQINNLTNFNFGGTLLGAGTLIKDGGGILTLSGNSTYSGNTTVAGGTLLVNGSIASNVIVGAGAGLGGTGAITGTVAIQANGSLSPGLSPGILNTGSLNLAGILNAEIQGPAPGSGYDRVNVTGTVTLNNPTLALTGAYVPVLGDQFILINNDGVDAVTGIFSGLPEGTTFTFNGRLMRITYVGGDGNDVALVPVTFNATSSANAGGTIAPLGVTPVLSGQQASFTITPNVGFSIAPTTGTCGGNLAVNIFTTNAVVANCTVIANFLISTYTVTSSGGGANGTITPASQPINHGSAAAFTVTPSAGYTASFGGTCPAGSFTAPTYTTGAITGPCNVAVTFTLNSYTVTSSGGGANGTITPPSQPVNHGSTAAFTVTPTAGYTASFGGTCPAGSFTAPTYTTGAITGPCNVAVTFTLNSYSVTSSGSGANGTITPPSQPVNHGSTAVFTVTPVAGYTASLGGTCPPGSLVGTTYTTGTITGPCNVAATFSLNSYTVTASAGANGTITPPSQTVAHGGTTNFTVTPSTGYAAVIGGTCPAGSLVGTTYTTGAITAACTVTATFSLNTYTVTSGAGPNGTITPPSQTVAHGATTTFTVTASPGYSAFGGGTCPTGSLVGTTYTTGAITAACTVSFTFLANAVTTFTGPTATGTGNATASFTGGGQTCTFTLAQLIPVTGHANSPPAGSAPAVVFPHGLFNFTTSTCTPGSAIVMTIVYPSALPAGTQYWKYGPEPGNAAPHWYVLPATITGSTVVFTITDGGQGDDDLTANGTIVDQGGPGAPAAGAGPIQTPTLSQWALMLLAAMLAMIGAARVRAREGPGRRVH